jgi:hypothetical protein
MTAPLPTTCPRCDAELERGAVVGQMRSLSWLPEGRRVGWTTLRSEHLRLGSLLEPPQLPAARCRGCGLGLFDAT